MGALEDHLQGQTEGWRSFFWHRVRWRAVSHYLPRSPSFTLLDIGAGAGILGSYLHRERPGARYRFIEPLATLEARLEETYGPDANARALKRFDGVHVVTLLDVLEHQEEDRAFLADLVERMGPGARLLMTVPALESLWSSWDVALGHHRRYDRASLGGCLRGLPARVLEVSYLFPELLPAAWLRTLMRRQAKGVSEAAFPALPPALNELLYLVGAGSVRLRRWWPGGTSLFAALERS
jgi:hypothetical protein